MQFLYEFHDLRLNIKEVLHVLVQGFQLSSLNACQGYDYASQDMIIMVLKMQDQVLNASDELGFQA